jgi:hypothetical protein
MDIRIDDLRRPEIAELLQEHLRDMQRVSPPESIHALDLESLRKPDITFWTIWDAGILAGCGALKALDPQHAEIKWVVFQIGTYAYLSLGLRVTCIHSHPYLEHDSLTVFS